MKFHAALLSFALVALLVGPAMAQVCPDLSGQWPHDTASFVTQAGSHAFLGHESLFMVADVSDPTAPEVVGSLGMDYGIGGLDAANGFVFVAAARLEVVDVGNPALPDIEGTLDILGATDVIVSGQYAYVADRFPVYGLNVVDVSDPSAPASVGTVQLFFGSEGGSSLAVSGQYVFLTWQDSFGPVPGGVKVIDVSDPAVPFEAGSLNFPESAGGIAVSRGYAYIGNGTLGLRVVDVSDPTNPVDLGVVDTPITADAVSVFGRFAWVADWGSLLVMDLANPELPVEVGFYDPSEFVTDVFFGVEHAYAANREDGLLVFDRCTLPVFSDGFETGDTTEWSTTVP